MTDKTKVDMDKPMTLEQVRDDINYHREYGDEVGPTSLDKWADALDARLACEVRVMDAEMFICYLIDNCERNMVTEESLHSWYADFLKTPRYSHAASRTVNPQAILSLPVATKVPDEITTHDSGGFSGMDERERGYVYGWNACREAMLAQGNDSLNLTRFRCHQFGYMVEAKTGDWLRLADVKALLAQGNSGVKS
jgi:hypothetical protein